MTSSQRSCLNTELLTVSPPRITHKQVGKLRFQSWFETYLGKDRRIAPDFEACHARGFVLHSLELQSSASLWES
ncbi:hypothetical protein Tco_1039784, partial [Tanacetum coccineum]